MAEALIALGGNVGDVRTTLARAIERLCDGEDVLLLARSSDYRTPAWGVTDQPDFINACIRIETGLPPVTLLDRVQAVERAFGRNRNLETRWGPRTLDIDLLTYDDLHRIDERLTLPHPRLLERAFVLIPLAEIAPDHVVAGQHIGHAAARAERSGIEKLPPLNR